MKRIIPKKYFCVFFLFLHHPKKLMNTKLTSSSLVCTRSIRVIKLEVVIHRETLTKDPSTLLHSKTITSKTSSSSSQDVPPSTITPTNTSIPTTISFKALNPYQRYWSIQGREIAKKTLRTYNNICSSEKVFGFDFIDWDRDEIHLFALDELAESFYNIIQVGKLYNVLNDTIKETNPN